MHAAMKRITNPIVIIVTLSLLNACSFSTRLTTVPEGADIYVNNIFVGKTPTIYKYRSGTPETSYIEVKKKGYDTIRNGTIEKSYRADMHLFWLIPGIIPYFVGTARYEDDYVFHLKER